MKSSEPKKFRRAFMSRFAPLVASGSKRQTIRKAPARMPKAGDLFIGFEWEGRPYGKGVKQKILIKSPIIEVLPIIINIHGGVKLNGLFPDLSPFAKADGFEDWHDMRDWFNKTHGLPFEGILIRW